MKPKALPVFNACQKADAHRFLATKVAEMMGRKFEEGDWSDVYTKALGIEDTGWSNLSIDMMHGNLGVEHKMICRPSHKPILDACGSSIMHPAGTRAIRIPNEEDPTTAARNVLAQYGDLISERTAMMMVFHHYAHSVITKSEATKLLGEKARVKPNTAARMLDNVGDPVGDPNASPDMRIGWLLWQNSLEEFLYFEEPMSAPQPSDFVAEWKSSGGGRRRKSRNLWVYEKTTGEKKYSITTEAGAKIQPYFKVPSPEDPNLYHFIVQGEVIEQGLVRVWLTATTARILSELVGDLSPENIDAALSRLEVSRLAHLQDEIEMVDAQPVLVRKETYDLLASEIEAVSDEHIFRIVVELLGRD